MKSPNQPGHFFPMPNELFSLPLSPYEISIYAYLMFREDRKTYQCHPSYRTIGEAVGMSENTVRKYVSALEQRKLITTEPTTIRTQEGLKRNGSLLYTVLPIRCALDYHAEQLMEQNERENERRRVQRLLEKNTA